MSVSDRLNRAKPRTDQGAEGLEWHANEKSWDGEKFIAEGMTEEDLKNMAEVDMDTLEQLDGDVTLTAAADM